MSSSSSTTATLAAAATLGFEECRRAFFKRFRAYRWLIGNLSESQRGEIYVVLGFAAKCLETLADKSQNHAPSVHWEEIRDELRQAILGQSKQPLAIALVEVVQRRSIAKQWLFDVLDGIDLWIRFRQFKTYDELSHFACKVGGGMVNQLIPIVEFERPGYAELAARAGTAMGLTQVLAYFHFDRQHQRCFLPSDLLQAAGLSASGEIAEEGQLGFARLIRDLACRAELEFYEAAPLLHYLSFDGQRVLRSLWEWHWELLLRIKQRPLGLLSHVVELHRAELAKLRLKHLLGTEGSHVPFVMAAGDANSKPHSH